ENKLRVQKEEYEFKLNNQKEEYESKLNDQQISFKIQLFEQKDKLTSAFEIEKKELINRLTKKPSVNKYAALVTCFNRSKEKIKSASEKYTIDYYSKKEKGMIDWCVNNLLRDENGNPTYICTDKSRGVFAFKDGEKIIVDNEAVILK